MGMKRALSSINRLRETYQQSLRDAERLFDGSVYRAHREQYVEYLNNTRIDKRAVLYECNHGRGVLGNPYALFLYLISDERFAKFQHYWAIDDESQKDTLPACFNAPNVHLVAYESDEYLRALASCKYLINNTSFLSHFTKRDGQVYVNTWHGTPIKSMGYDLKDGATASANIIRNMLSADYLLSENQIMSSMYLDSYRLRGIYGGTILEEGYPRTDLSLATPREAVLQRLALLGVDVDPAKKIILYAPTWKAADHSNIGINPECDPEALLQVKRELEAQIDATRYQVLIKPHQFVYMQIKNMPEYAGQFVPTDIDANELMSAVDMLVSDFSSIVFDYLVLNRPILLYVPDLDEYQRDRGITYPLENMPGPAVKTLTEIAAFINELDQGIDRYTEKRQAAVRDICPKDDGTVCQRVVDIVFNDAPALNVADAHTSKRKLLIMGGGYNANGISRSLTCLLRQIDFDKLDTTVFMTNGDADISIFLESIPPQVRVMLKAGTLLDTRKEEALRETLDFYNDAHPLVRKLYPDKVFVREHRRCFGLTSFDIAIDFNGYERINAGIVALSSAPLKCLWMHNDMQMEMQKQVGNAFVHRKNLTRIFSLHPRFDRLVSCTEAISEINKQNLATTATADRFCHVKNCVDDVRVNACLEVDPVIIDGEEYHVDHQGGPPCNTDFVRLPSAQLTSFINVGRLSPEKNQLALVHAFASLHEQYPQTELYILGDGPLREEIEQTTRDLGIDDCVHLTGNVENPFIFMRYADCFVFPSLYEGQGLSVLEARLSGLPIIVSRFGAVESVCVEGGQLFVDFDEESIRTGLQAFMEKKVPRAPFSAEKYNREAYAEFERMIG